MIFAIIRTNYIINENEIINIEFKSIAIASCSFPFGIIKEAFVKDCFSPFYYILIHYLTVIQNSTVAIKIFNSAIALLNIFLIAKIGKQILNRSLGYFLAILFAINHFFLYYTNLIAPYCINILLGTILIKTVLDFTKKPNKKHFKFLLISNILFILANNLSFLYVIPELILLYFYYDKRIYIKKQVIKISTYSFFVFLITFPLLIIQYYNWNNTIIPNTFNGIGFNLNSLYLTINEYLSPYLSFESSDIYSKSTIGMIFSFLINPDIKNLNNIKILVTLFYSSIFPMFILIWYSFKIYKKNHRLSFLFSIALVNFILTALLMLYEIIETNPIYLTQFFITSMIVLGYGVCKIKDKFFRWIVIFCFIAIQFINPDINSFKITVNNNYPVINAFDIFIKEYKVNNSDLVIMPYLGSYAKLRYKDLNIFNFDYSMLQKNNKKSIVRSLCNKNTSSINKNNIHSLIRDYLTQREPNNYLTKYFVDNSSDYLDRRIIIYIDKLNSRPISKMNIVKIATMEDYTTKIRKLDFKNKKIEQNKTKLLFDAIKSKTIYNFIGLIASNFTLEKIVEYKKVDDEYYKLKNSTYDIQYALSSHESDYIFLIFKTYR